MYSRNRLGDYGGLSGVFGAAPAVPAPVAPAPVAPAPAPKLPAPLPVAPAPAPKLPAPAPKPKPKPAPSSKTVIPIHVGYGYPYNQTYGYGPHYGHRPPGYPDYGYRDDYYRRSREPRVVMVDRPSRRGRRGIHMPTLLAALGAAALIFSLKG